MKPRTSTTSEKKGALVSDAKKPRSRGKQPEAKSIFPPDWDDPEAQRRRRQKQIDDLGKVPDEVVSRLRPEDGDSTIARAMRRRNTQVDSAQPKEVEDMGSAFEPYPDLDGGDGPKSPATKADKDWFITVAHDQGWPILPAENGHIAVVLPFAPERITTHTTGPLGGDQVTIYQLDDTMLVRDVRSTEGALVERRILNPDLINDQLERYRPAPHPEEATPTEGRSEVPQDPNDDSWIAAAAREHHWRIYPEESGFPEVILPFSTIIKSEVDQGTNEFLIYREDGPAMILMRESRGADGWLTNREVLEEDFIQETIDSFRPAPHSEEEVVDENPPAEAGLPEPPPFIEPLMTPSDLEEVRASITTLTDLLNDDVVGINRRLNELGERIPDINAIARATAAKVQDELVIPHQATAESLGLLQMEQRLGLLIVNEAIVSREAHKRWRTWTLILAAIAVILMILIEVRLEQRGIGISSTFSSRSETGGALSDELAPEGLVTSVVDEQAEVERRINAAWETFLAERTTATPPFEIYDWITMLLRQHRVSGSLNVYSGDSISQLLRLNGYEAHELSDLLIASTQLAAPAADLLRATEKDIETVYKHIRKPSDPETFRDLLREALRPTQTSANAEVRKAGQLITLSLDL